MHVHTHALTHARTHAHTHTHTHTHRVCEWHTNCCLFMQILFPRWIMNVSNRKKHSLLISVMKMIGRESGKEVQPLVWLHFLQGLDCEGVSVWNSTNRKITSPSHCMNDFQWNFKVSMNDCYKMLALMLLTQNGLCSQQLLLLCLLFKTAGAVDVDCFYI